MSSALDRATICSFSISATFKNLLTLEKYSEYCVSKGQSVWDGDLEAYRSSIPNTADEDMIFLNTSNEDVTFLRDFLLQTQSVKQLAVAPLSLTQHISNRIPGAYMCVKHMPVCPIWVETAFFVKPDKLGAQQESFNGQKLLYSYPETGAGLALPYLCRSFPCELSASLTAAELRSLCTQQQVGIDDEVRFDPEPTDGEIFDPNPPSDSTSPANWHGMPFVPDFEIA